MGLVTICCSFLCLAPFNDLLRLLDSVLHFHLGAEERAGCFTFQCSDMDILSVIILFIGQHWKAMFCDCGNILLYLCMI